ncbi:MAG: hypothetical protein ACK4RK_01155 [Gemmataceae bacterium]
MATFYLLPPRPALRQDLDAYLQRWFPGLSCPAERLAELMDLCGAIATQAADVFIVHREDLPLGEDAVQALRDGFGAEAGDEIIEIRAGQRPGELHAHRCRVPVLAACE